MTKKRAGKPGEAVAKIGRPSSYRDEYAEQAEKLCLLGATDADLARSFGVGVTTIDTWKLKHPAFLGAVKAGKEQADAEVADKLYRRALGYEHEAVKIAVNTRTGDEYVVPYIERYPPETVAAIFWLKNRRPDLWRDKAELTIVSPDIQARLARQVVVIHRELPRDVADRLLDALTAEVWTT